MRSFYSTFLLLLSFSFNSFAQTNAKVESVEYDPIGDRFTLGDHGTSLIQLTKTD